MLQQEWYARARNIEIFIVETMSMVNAAFVGKEEELSIRMVTMLMSLMEETIIMVVVWPVRR